MNRGPEQRQDKKPAISDLRESGSIEQDADMVILLHRENAYDKDVRPGEADLIVAKHRNGPTATIEVAFQGHFSRFTDMAGGEPAYGGGGAASAPAPYGSDVPPPYDAPPQYDAPPPYGA